MLLLTSLNKLLFSYIKYIDVKYSSLSDIKENFQIGNILNIIELPIKTN